jgi:recombination protein RecR
VSAYSPSVLRLINEFSKLPGIGRKSAERLAHYILRANTGEAMNLAEAIRAVKENIRHCSRCYNLSEGELCSICQDPRRDPGQVCVVEQPRDLMALEQTGTYQGTYHVLLGRISPLEGVRPDQLTIEQLLQRVKEGTVREVIMATNPTVEGDATAAHLAELLAEYTVAVTRLARGIPAGSVLEFANKEMLTDALSGRQRL